MLLFIFTGNDCNAYLKREVYGHICESIVKKCQEITTQPAILIRARAISSKFAKLWSKFSQIHHLVSHSNFITERQILLIGEQIRSFMSYFRDKFPEESITLKLHIMEDHLVENLIYYRFGLGMFGEQGVESIHHKIKDICSRFHHIPNGDKRLKSTVEEHHLHTLPVVRKNIPIPAKRAK